MGHLPFSWRFCPWRNLNFLWHVEHSNWGSLSCECMCWWSRCVEWNVLSQVLQLWAALGALRHTCLVRFRLFWNDLLHFSQRWGLTPLWALMWLWKSDLFINVLAQCWQEYLGPCAKSCFMRLCSLRLDIREKIFPQSWQSSRTRVFFAGVDVMAGRPIASLRSWSGCVWTVSSVLTSKKLSRVTADNSICNEMEKTHTRISSCTSWVQLVSKSTQYHH